MQVISAVTSALGEVRMTFDAAPLRPALAAYIRSTIGPALDRVGLTPKPGEPGPVTILRPSLITWLYEANDARVKEFIRTEAAKYLADPSTVDPSLAGTVVNLSAIDGDEALFNEYKKRFENAKTPGERSRFLAALGNFREPAIHAKALEYSLNGPLRPNELLALSRYEGTAEAREESYRWITAHFDQIALRLPRPYLAFMPTIASGCEKDRVEEARKFFSDEKRRVDGTERALARVAEQVDQCVALRSREMESVSKYLEGGR